MSAGGPAESSSRSFHSPDVDRLGIQSSSGSVQTTITNLGPSAMDQQCSASENLFDLSNNLNSYRRQSETSWTTNSSYKAESSIDEPKSFEVVTEQEPVLFVRALYDYDSNEPNSLSFKAGELISVCIQLDTGWWDGQIGDGIARRGWFPSNFCKPIPMDEIPEGTPVAMCRLVEDMVESYSSVEGSTDCESRDETESAPARDLSKDSFGFSDVHSVSPTSLVTDSHSYNKSSRKAASESGGMKYLEHDNDSASTPGALAPISSGQFVFNQRKSAGSDSSYYLPQRSPSNVISLGTNAQISNSIGPSPTDSPNKPSWDELLTIATTSIHHMINALKSHDRTQYTVVVDDILESLSTILIGAGFSGFSIGTSDRALSQPFRQLMVPLGRLVLVSEIAAVSVSDSLTTSPVISGSTTEENLSTTVQEADCLSTCEKILIAVSKLVAAARQISPVPISQSPGGDNESIGESSWGNLSFSMQRTQSTSSASFDNFWGLPASRHNSESLRILNLDEDSLKLFERHRTLVTTALRDILRFLDRHTYDLHADGDLLIERTIEATTLIRGYLYELDLLDLTALSKPPSPTVSDFRFLKQTVYDLLAGFLLDTQNLTSQNEVQTESDITAKFDKLRTSTRDLDRSVQSIIVSIDFMVEEKSLRETTSGGAVADTSVPAGEESIAQRRRVSVVSSFMGSVAESEDDASLEEEEEDEGSRNRGRSRRIVDKIYEFGISESSSNNDLSKSMAYPTTKSELKLRQFFGGDDLPTKAYALTSGANRRDVVRRRDETPWYLKNEHESELIYDSRGAVKGGTLIALLERLTRHDFLDTSFNSTFLLTYRSFTNSRTLFDMLISRFTIQPPDNLQDDEFEEWVERKQKPIRLRVFNILKMWVEQYWVDGGSSDSRIQQSDAESAIQSEVLKSLAVFANLLVQQQFPGATTLAKAVMNRQNGNEITSTKNLPVVYVVTSITPPSILPKRGAKNAKFLHFHATEIARQLTLIEFALFIRIRPSECLNRARHVSQRTGTNENNPGGDENITALIAYSNQLTNYTANLVLSYHDVKKRVGVIKHLVTVADQCQHLHNFSSMTAIISGLRSATIHRLVKTWELVPQKVQIQLENLTRVMDSSRNFGEYRAMLHLISPPCVPFFGVYLTDLTFIEDGNSNTLIVPVSAAASAVSKEEEASSYEREGQADEKQGSDNATSGQSVDAEKPSPAVSTSTESIINFSKRTRAAEVIREIQQYQSTPYSLHPVIELQDILREGLERSPSLEKLYDMSLSIEPRERPGEDDRLARMLSESGML
ncbi:ras guanine nucleotide exchange factor domain-containing protein [Lipomyces oligophaga]|uniref:ras guanine nucleotide exchange factor domain-containing protein n=1 Tax=Lipomyces oligophaga TaxID=45792 RepID=UPI0034CE5E15